MHGSSLAQIIMRDVLPSLVMRGRRIVLSVSFSASTHFRSASYVACFPDSRSKVPECTDVPVCTTIEFLILTVSWEVKGSSILHGSSGTKVGGARSTRWV